MSFVVAPIVEGYGDEAAVPLLLRTMAPTLQVGRPVRFPRGRLTIAEHLLRAAAIANANIRDQGAILLVMDADEDCAAALGPQLEEMLRSRFGERMCRVVLAVREFENWIIGGTASYGVDDADRAGDAKGRIKAAQGVYKETVDQAKLIARADLHRLAQVSRSFRRLRKVIDEFVASEAQQSAIGRNGLL